VGVAAKLTRKRTMNDETITIADLRARIAAFNAARDWGQFHSPRNLAMAVSVEAGELLELFLWSADDGPQPAVAEREPRVAEEAADVAITLLNLCEQAGIDLASAVEAKLAANEARYPVDKARGRMLKHDEL
jgi:NTP pyrophosphatase (non-canonical NTP hydrolase)